jgi:hypothetical protein
MPKLPIAEYPDDFHVETFAWPAATPAQRGVIFIADRDMEIDHAEFSVTVGAAANLELYVYNEGATDLSIVSTPNARTNALAVNTSVGNRRIWTLTEKKTIKAGQRLGYFSNAVLTGVTNLTIKVRVRSRKE